MISPETTPVGLLTVTEADVLVADVAVPRNAICENNTLLLNANVSSNIALEIIPERLKCERVVPMRDKKLVFSYKLVAKIISLIHKKQQLIKI